MTNLQARSGQYINPAGIIPEQRSWSTIVRCVGRAIRTHNIHEPLYEAYLAVLAPNLARGFHQLRAHPNGRELLRHKPDIMQILHDGRYLSSLPPGTLGHAYHSFMTTNQLHPGVYDDHGVIRPVAEKNNWSDDFYYLLRRGTALHDLFHTIGGYGPDIAGEAANIGFHCGQMEPAGAFLRWGWYLSLIYPGAPIRQKLRYFWQAVERGRRADNLMAAPWEDLMDKPINEVRELLGVAPTAIAHPDGHLYTPWAPTGNGPVARWDYDAMLESS